jgi:hypothetical protein
VPVVSGFEHSNISSLVNYFTNCASASGKVEPTILQFLHGASCGRIQTLQHKIISQLFYQLTTGKVEPTFPHFSPGASCGWIQTLQHKIISQSFYQLCHCHWQVCTNYIAIFIWCQQWLDSNPPT